MERGSMEFRTKAYNRLNEIIETGRDNMGRVLSDIQREYDIRRDFIAKPKVIDFEVSNGKAVPVIDSRQFEITDHATSQMFSMLNIPKQYGDKLIALGEDYLLKENLRRMTNRMVEGGVLLRTVDNNVKGWLSTAYKRMDATPIFASFVEAMMGAGFVPNRAMNTDYRYHLSFIYPEVVELVPNEFVVFGASMTTGDYGGTALTMTDDIIRVICTNMMIGRDALRKIHIGKRFEDDVQLSNETHTKDALTVASAIKDISKGVIDRTKAMGDIVKENAEKDIDVKQAIQALGKKGFSKKVLEAVNTMYEQEAITELLPPDKGTWRFANTLSLVAQSQPGDVRLDLEREAGVLLGTGA